MENFCAIFVFKFNSWRLDSAKWREMVSKIKMIKKQFYHDRSVSFRVIMHLLNLKHYSIFATLANDLYILSAARTPIGSVNGSLLPFSSTQLGALAVKEALERAKVPVSDVQSVFMGCNSERDLVEEPTKQVAVVAGLPKSVTCLTVCSKCTSGLKSIELACKFLMKNEKGVSIAGGMESMSNGMFLDRQDFLGFFFRSASSKTDSQILHENYLRNQNFSQDDQNNYSTQDYENLLKAYKSGAYKDEIIKTVFRRNGKQIIVNEDETVSSYGDDSFLYTDESTRMSISASGDGATALVIATGDYVKKNHLTPLVKVVAFADDDVIPQDFHLASVGAIEKALKIANCTPEQISQWEVNDFFSTLSLTVLKQLNINRSLLNKDGGTVSLGHPIGMSGARIVCHLAHSLSVGELGCAAGCNTDGKGSAVIVEKLSFEMPATPRLKLYTKHPCPLCDELKEQLKPFEGRFNLEEVDIEREENNRYRKLYRYEIPVLFLNGRFLCKHSLDVEQFKRRLEEIEKAFPANRK